MLAFVGKIVLRAAATLSLCCAVLSGFSIPALAGPPYLTDDPEPTDYKHFEIYAFSQGMATQDGVAGEGGIDFNYGGAPNLQLTATVPAAYNFPTSGSSATGPGNIELAAKYRFLTQDNFGFDVAVFPRVILPSASPNVGDQHASYLLPIWIEKDWGKWSAFGGGGCEVNREAVRKTFVSPARSLPVKSLPIYKSGWNCSIRRRIRKAAKRPHRSAPASNTI